MVDLSRQWDRLRRGEPVDLRSTPDHPAVEAALLADLLTVPVGTENWSHRPVRLAGARITGPLDLEAAVLTRPLHLEDCLFEETVILRDAEAITIRLSGCEVPGIDAHALHTRGDLRLNEGFASNGEVNLIGAHIGGTLNCDRASFITNGKYALNADLIVVGGSVWMGRSRFEGQVVLLLAKIGGSLSCSRSSFSNQVKSALRADGMQIGGDLLLNKGFTATGEIRLLGTRIGGLLDVSGATLINQSGTALNADNIRIEGDLVLQGLTATGCGEGGTLRLAGAQIGGRVSASTGATETRLTNESGPALYADHSRVGQGLYLWRGLKLTGTGRVGALSLRGARVGVLGIDLTAIQDPDGAPGQLRVEGLEYAGLPQAASVDDWLELLAHRTPQYAAQPYQQLASAARAMGNDGANRKILMAQRRDQLGRRALKGGAQRAWARFTGLTLGYGYQPWRALLLLVGVAAVTVGLCLVGGAQGGLAHPVNATACTAVERIGVGLDLSVPLIKTGAQETCTTSDTALGDVITVTGWILQLAAWALATLFVAGFTGAVRKS